MITPEDLAAMAVKAERMRESMDLNRVELASACLHLITEVEALGEANDQLREELHYVRGERNHSHHVSKQMALDHKAEIEAGHDLWERTTYRIEAERDKLRDEVASLREALKLCEESDP